MKTEIYKGRKIRWDGKLWQYQIKDESGQMIKVYSPDLPSAKENIDMNDERHANARYFAVRIVKTKLIKGFESEEIAQRWVDAMEKIESTGKNEYTVLELQP